MTSASKIARHPQSTRAWASLAFSAVALLASPVQAHPSFLDVARRPNDELVLSCTDDRDCSDGSDCSIGEECVTVYPGEDWCIEPDRRPRFQVFCCESNGDCPDIDGASEPTCSPLLGDVSVCRWTTPSVGLRNFCGGNAEPTLDDVIACVSSSSGGLSLAEGDCDGDDIPNDADAEPCRPVVIDPPVDASVVPVEDLGVEEDLGMTDGGGTVPRDLGGRVDSGSSVPQVRFQGGGGCSTGTSRGVPSHALLGIVALVLARRRRRAR